MNIFEALGLIKYLHKDEYGNVYFQGLEWQSVECLNTISVKCIDFCEGLYFIDKETYEKYLEYQIEIENDVKYSGLARRPYYRMRGKSVTKEQAFDIIRRTDMFFGDIYLSDGIRGHSDFVGSLNFNNWLINRNHYPMGYGWVHTDGTIGSNSITQKYPEMEEFIAEWFRYLMAFPYLDLVIAITNWDEIPPEAWYDDTLRDSFYKEKYDEEFYKAIEIGIRVKDKTIQVLGPESTIKLYKEYEEKYGVEREKYEPEYYQDRGIAQVDLAYLKRCIESYGLNAEKELSKLPIYELQSSKIPSLVPEEVAEKN